MRDRVTERMVKGEREERVERKERDETFTQRKKQNNKI